MRELGNICLRCRFRLLVASRAQTRRGFSTASAAADPSPSQNEAESWTTPSESLPRQPSDDATPTTGPMIRRVSGSRRSSSLAMFQSIVERQVRASATAKSPGGGTAGIDLVKDVAKIQIMLEREGATLSAAYSFFADTVYPQIRKSLADVPQIVKNQIGTVLLNRVALDKPQSFESTDLPSVTRITEMMVELDVLKPAVWATLMIELIQHIWRQSTLPDDYTSIESYENAMAHRDALLRDLVGAWKVFCEQRSPAEGTSATEPAERNEAEFHPPRPGARPQHQPTLQKAFAAMFPQYLAPTLLRPTCAAYATYKLLTDPFNRARSIKQEAAPFLQMMESLIFQARPPRMDDFRPVFDAFPDLSRCMRSRKQGENKSNSFLKPVSIPGGNPDHLRVAIHRQLGQAIKSRNLGAVKKAWQDFWGDSPVPDAKRIQELVKCSDLFDYFILAYMIMWRPQLAIQVWNDMERIGIRPTIKTWNSMLQGCAKAKNANGVNTVWQKLITSNIKLDTAIWTARIDALFVSGEPEAGLRALDEMAKTWAARHEPRYAAIAVQPTIEPVNAALAGLLRLERGAEAKTVLAWAAKQGIEPDIYTFNTLLRPLVRQGDMAGIEHILSLMRSSNIEADVATFTVLLEGVLTNIGDLIPDQQVALVKRVLSEMKDAGVDVNMQTYAKILYLLLREGDRAGEAVKAVLAHIWRRGLELTSHIYTMLAEHYFARDPPDAAAVTALIENRRLHDNRAIDRVFWERVIKGYCQAGETRRAVAIFDRVFVPGTTMTFSMLYELLRALIACGEMGDAARVVEAARKIGRAEDDDVDAAAVVAHQEGKRYWKHRFWHLAYEHGFLEERLADRFRAANAPPVTMELL
ncbi:hypothetical protein VTK56DRAFT_7701 [Thermocarpiscus australiensis]